MRPRYGRLGAALAALMVTLIALLGGVGVLPTGAPAAAAAGNDRSASRAQLATVTTPDATGPVTPSPTPESQVESTAIPPDSGSGKRVVFDISDQRVWLVDDGDRVLRTYLVSGSLTDNLGPGTFEVYSHSRWATGIQDSGDMQYFVRFTHGANAAIGFHSIPTKDGRPLQTGAQLGTPQSHGCIREALPDAKKLWDFAPVGTKVVVTA